MSSWKIGWPRAVPEFFRKATISFSMRFGGLFIQFLGSILVARLLGASGYGAFTYASTWAVFAGTFLSLGIGELSIREIPTYLSQKKTPLLAGYLIMGLLTLLVAGTIATIVLAMLEKTGTLHLAPGWKLVALLAFIHATIIMVSNGLNSFQRILTSQFLETILRMVLYLALIGLAWLAGLSMTPKLVFVLSLLAPLVPLFLMFRVMLGKAREAGVFTVRPQFRIGLWLAGAIPLLMTTVANRLQLDLDVLMVGGLLGDREVGIYRAAARGAILVTIANMVALQLVGPMLSRALAQDNHKEAQRLLSQAAMVSLLTSLPIIAVFGFGASLYLGLFGHEFLEASRSLRLLLVGQSTVVLAGADSVLLIMLHRERFVFLITTLGVVLNFVLNYSLIGPLGIDGAAIASLVSMAVVRATLVTYLIKTTGFNTTVFHALGNLFRTRRG